MPKEDIPDIKERLLVAGLKIFSEKGYNGATFKDICDEAGSNIAAINYHFNDKVGFYMAVRNYMHGLISERMKHSWSLIDKDPWMALRYQIEVMLDMNYDSTLYQVNWMALRELMEIDSIPELRKAEDYSAKKADYEEKMTKMMSGLLGDAATLHNISLLRYTYYSLCRFLPIHRRIEEKFHNKNGRFNVSDTDKNEMVEFIFDAVKANVERMKSKSSSVSANK